MSDSAEHDIGQALLERLNWRMAKQDNQAVAPAIASHGEADSIHALDQTALLDDYMTFLSLIGFVSYLSELKLAVRKRFMVPVVIILLTYMTKVLCGIASVYSLPSLLFSDQGVMKLLGFNAFELQNGICRRSHQKRSKGKPPPKPFCPQMLANFIGDLLISESQRFFNQAILCLARFGVFPRKAVVILDGTDIETTAKCLGAGRAIREKTFQDRHGCLRTTQVVVFGFKVVVAFELTTQIPVACIVMKVHRHDNLCARRLIRQAQANLAAGGSQIHKVIVDRGFLDGQTMWWLHKQGIIFVLPAKSNMVIYNVACAEARTAKHRIQCRQRTITHGRGKHAYQETLETEVVGIAGLKFWDAYSDPQSLPRIGRRGFRPEPINAVVVRKWDNKEYGPGSHVVFLTNQSVNKPLLVFDDYDGRSLIENMLFREGKQGWHLKQTPQKTQRATVAHICITLGLVALTTAYREWYRREKAAEREQDDPADEFEEEQEVTFGIRRWRRERQKQNRDYLILFKDNVYGIFHMAEFAVLAGMHLRDLPKQLGSREDIFTRYGLDPPS